MNFEVVLDLYDSGCLTKTKLRLRYTIGEISTILDDRRVMDLC